MGNQQIVLKRLNQLVSKGYAIEWGPTDYNTLRLQHPDRETVQLELYPDGRVEQLKFPGQEDDYFEVDERGERRFRSFLDKIPRPTWRQALAATTVGDLSFKTVYWIVCAIIIGAVAYVGARIAVWLNGA